MPHGVSRRKTMITGEHGVIRSMDPDDAEALLRLYIEGPPRSSLLDRKRELILPTAGELREMLGRKESIPAGLLVVEDREGKVCGFCGLRHAGAELAYAELVLMFHDEAVYRAPLALETLRYLCQNAFMEKRLNKLIAHCLDTEPGWRMFVSEMGFTCDGRQRDVLYAGGHWHDVELFSLFRSDAAERNLI